MSDEAPHSPVAGEGDDFAVTYVAARDKFLEAALQVPGCVVHSFRVGGSSTSHSQYVAARHV